MNTAEMWLKAQEDGKVYECIDGDIAYSKEYGLTEKYDFDCGWSLKAWDYKGAYGLDDLLGNCEWKEVDDVMTLKKDCMTIEEAEEKFGIRIVID